MVSLDEFAEALSRYHLLPSDQAGEGARALFARFPEPRALARELLQRGWLTAYQVNHVLQGRGAELLLGSYVLLERLGEGGMGQVFQARNWKLGQVVALKLIRKERVDNPDAVRRFQREIRAAAQLNHPNIVRAFDADAVDGAHFFVMEYIEGTDLSKLVKQHGPPPVAQACDYVRQAALGLQHAHERGLIHRDIKPHNLLRTKDGVVKILDMGLARLTPGGDGELSSTLTEEGAVMGTPDFIAPEQVLDAHTADIRADLYSLGCTLYYLLAGRVPFPGGNLGEKLMKHQLREPQPVELLRADVPSAVAGVARRLMAKKPEDRYQTPAELAAVLHDLVRPRPAPPAPRPAEFPSLGGDTALASQSPFVLRKKAERRRLLLLNVGLGGALLVMVGVLLFLLFREPGGTSNTGRADPEDGGATGQPGVSDPNTNSIGMTFVRVPRGKFWTGGGGGKPGDRQVEIQADFYLAIHETTQGQWQAVMGDNPSYFSRTGDGKDRVKDVSDADLQQFPVENVSWDMVQDFIKKVSAREKDRGWLYRLPTSEEWEYACRASREGEPSKEDCAFDFYFDQPTNDLSSEQANFNGNGPAGKAAKGPNLGRPAKVGSYRPNRLGLYDMHGNVWEWCEDTLPRGSGRVFRGGGWYINGSHCRAALLNVDAPSSRSNGLGFRLARVRFNK
jgi:serine/threonine protein kinase/formylglycine-generating enzyme required for sulfatase activity